ncbi:MAG: undecaprenyl-diphosphate phosphatase, partial [bacterium]
MLDLIILGIVQGLTEFLPISSTAHLLFAEHYLGLRRPGIALEAALHLGTVAAAVVLFWTDVVRLVRGGIALLRRPALAWGRADENADGYPRLAASIVAATAITAALGLAFAGPLQRMFESVRGAAYQLLATGAILLWSRERGTRSAPQASVADGAALGLAQASSIIPGISRSGITIVTGIALGMRRTEAARLSFLIGIPAVLGASVFGLKDVKLAAQLGHTALELVVGFLVAAVVGAVAILWLITLVRRGRLIAFSAYCWLVGIL